MSAHTHASSPGPPFVEQVPRLPARAPPHLNWRAPTLLTLAAVLLRIKAILFAGRGVSAVSPVACTTRIDTQPELRAIMTQLESRELHETLEQELEITPKSIAAVVKEVVPDGDKVLDVSLLLKQNDHDDGSQSDDAVKVDATAFRYEPCTAVPLGHDLDGFTVDGLLTPAECAWLIEKTETLDYSFWDARKSTNPSRDRPFSLQHPSFLHFCPNPCKLKWSHEAMKAATPPPLQN
jgi:hypothetical protein